MRAGERGRAAVYHRGGGLLSQWGSVFYENGAKEWVGSIDDSRYSPGLERQDNAPQVITGKT